MSTSVHQVFLELQMDSNFLQIIVTFFPFQCILSIKILASTRNHKKMELLQVHFSEFQLFCFTKKYIKIAQQLFHIKLLIT